MLMTAILKVTPEKLIETAMDFNTCENNIRSLAQEMTTIVDSLKPVWQGEAATGFANRFASLSEDMNRLYALIRKHSNELTEMAEEYRQAESESVDIASTLVTKAVS